MSEHWRVVAGWDAYEVSDLGRVRRARPGNGTRVGRVLSPYAAGPTGHRQVDLHQDGRSAARYVHLFVLESFGPPRPSPAHECNHIDGDPGNNAIGNLEWVTHSENLIHARDTGLQQPMQGEAHGMARLSESNVLDIRDRASGEETQRAIAAEYGVAETTVSMIVRRQTWRHI